MSYTVLARKYRSRTLAEVVGQSPIVRTLSNAIESGRIHHGYLFCGTRGVGKTSTARILAKSLNCLENPSPTVNPCLACDACRAIAEGEDLDVIEIDAASNTGVDNIRQLRENAAYRPARSRFKIYIIDEVHMLSSGAFNALLKTLEEPPEHVKFVLATTELHKVPATIQSRVQRFDFQSISHESIAEQLRSICSAEGVSCDEPVVHRVSRAAKGSMRDALSILDQLLSRGAAHVDVAMAEEVLPNPYDEILAELIDAMVEADSAKALSLVERYAESGKTLEQFCDNFIEQLRTLLVLKVCGKDTHLVDCSSQIGAQLDRLKEHLIPDVLVYSITLLENLRRQVKSAGAGRALVDAAVVRLCHSRSFSDVEAVLESVEAGHGPAKKKMTERGAPRPEPETTLQPPQRPAPRVSGDELQEAKADPLVRRTLELFEGTLLNVERINTNPTPAAGPPAGAP